MGKNSNIVDIMEVKETSLSDESFKDIARYKCIASLLVKLVIPEFKEMSCIDIAKHIINHKQRGDMTDEQMMQDEIDLEKTEIGTGNEKNTINDIVFLMRLPTTGETIKTVIKPELTVNFEMQKETKKGTLGYDILSRAVYYAASLLRDTVPAGDKTYSNIHKVYTIWFCNNSLKIERYPEVKNEFIHYYGMRRFYPHVPKTATDEEADLMCVAMVELPLLKNYMENELYNSIVNVFYNTANSVNLVENIEKINLTKFRKVVSERMDWEAKAKEREQEAREQGLEQGLEQGREQGLEQGLEQGREQGLEKSVYTMLKESLNDSPEMTEEKLRTRAKKYLKASDETINKVLRKIRDEREQ